MFRGDVQRQEIERAGQDADHRERAEPEPARTPNVFDVIVVGLFAASAMLRTLVLIFLPTTLTAIATHLASGRHPAVSLVLSLLTAFLASTSLSASAFVLRRGPGRRRVSAAEALANELSEPAVPLAACALLVTGELLRFDSTLLGTLPGLPFLLLGLLVAVLAPSEGLGAIAAIGRAGRLLRTAPLRFIATLGTAYLASGTVIAVPVFVVSLLGVPLMLTASLLLTIAGPMLAGVLFAATAHLRHVDALRTAAPQGLSRLERP